MAHFCIWQLFANEVVNLLKQAESNKTIFKRLKSN